MDDAPDLTDRHADAPATGHDEQDMTDDDSEGDGMPLDYDEDGNVTGDAAGDADDDGHDQYSNNFFDGTGLPNIRSEERSCRERVF